MICPKIFLVFPEISFSYLEKLDIANKELSLYSLFPWVG